MSSYPHVHLAYKAASQPVKSLVDIAIDTCVQHKHRLGDVGFIEGSHLRRILQHCSRQQLEVIEDTTLEASGRDLSWFSWDCWFVIFSNLFGPPQPGELLDLAAEVPVDYTPPAGQFAQPADYRSMVYVREAAIEHRKQAAVSRLRGAYQQETQQREALQVKYTERLPPPKRAKRGTALMAQLLPLSQQRKIAGKPVSKVLQNLGLSGSHSSSKSGFRSQQHQQRTTYGNGAYSTVQRPSSSSMQHKQQQQQQRPTSSNHSGNSSLTAGSVDRGTAARQQQQQQLRSPGSSSGLGSGKMGRQAAGQQRQGLVGHKRSNSNSSAGGGGDGGRSGVKFLNNPIALGSRPRTAPPASASAGAAAGGGARRVSAGPSVGRPAAAAAAATAAAAAKASGKAAGAGPQRSGGAGGLLDRPLTLSGKR